MTVETGDNEFYVCLLSNSSLGCYSSNVLSAFTNLLKKPCKLNEHWYVGLTEIVFNEFSSNYGTLRKREVQLNTNNDKKGVSEADSNVIKKKSKRDIEERKPLSKKKTIQKRSIEINPTLSIPYGMSHLVPQNAEGVMIRPPDDDQLGNIFTPWLNNNTNYKSDGMEHFPYTSVHSNTKTPFLYVYTDIIKPRLIGDIQSRFLRVIPTPKGERHLRFTHVEYCPLEKTYIENISILITDSQGERVNFNASTSPTYIMLHFKKNLGGKSV